MTMNARIAAAALLVCSFTGAPAAAQLRPLDPLEWEIFDAARGIVMVGGGLFGGQRASLAGTEGRLTELGSYRVAWRAGSVVLEASGTAVWAFRDERVVEEPTADARPPDGRIRRDAGTQQLATVVRLTPTSWPWLAALRFGVRLPTSNNLVGLERDQTDFFTTVGARWMRGALALSGEAGLGINGTRDSRLEQVDVLLYAVGIRYRRGPVQLRSDILGQHDTRRGAPMRGTEDLQEVRAGLRVGRDRWLRILGVRGLATVSPRLGLMVGVGLRY